MRRLNNIETVLPSTTRTPRRGRPAGRRAPARRSIRVEQLECRTTPTLLSVFELDANVATGVLGTMGSTTTSHDWDQVYADSVAVPPGSTSGALASSFVTDKVNSNTDDIYTGGGSKDTLGIEDGRCYSPTP